MNRWALRALSLGLMLGLNYVLEVYADRLDELEGEDCGCGCGDAERGPLCDCGRPWPCDCGDLEGEDLPIFAEANRNVTVTLQVQPVPDPAGAE